MIDLAKIAYEAYCQRTNWKSAISGAPLPQWDAQSQAIKDAWDSAAQAVARAVSG